MIYTFIKKMVPILLVAVTIYSLVFLIYIGGMSATSYMIKQKALEIKGHSSDDIDFANNVKLWVYHHINIPPANKGMSAIQPPEIAYLTNQGDCSERSLLMTRMLQEGGIEAHPIYGTVGAVGHMSVEYITNGTVNMIEENEIPDFVKHGDGISTFTEYVYDLYWFLDWKAMLGMDKPDKHGGYS